MGSRHPCPGRYVKCSNQPRNLKVHFPILPTDLLEVAEALERRRIDVSVVLDHQECHVYG